MTTTTTTTTTDPITYVMFLDLLDEDVAAFSNPQHPAMLQVPRDHWERQGRPGEVLMTVERRR